MSIKYAILPMNYIEELILRIEAGEAFVKRKSVRQLNEDGDMPHIYFELLAAKENAWTFEGLDQNYKAGISKIELSRPSAIRIAEPDKTI